MLLLIQQELDACRLYLFVFNIMVFDQTNIKRKSRSFNIVKIIVASDRAFTHPGVVDASDALLRPVQHQEGRQVGGVRRYDDHGEPGPHHPQDPG